jgi:hypothetical protein
MAFNGYPTKPVSEYSEYQKKIESIDNVILCVAEAESMVNQVGSSLLPDLAVIKPNKRRRSKPASRSRCRSAARRSAG